MDIVIQLKYVMFAKFHENQWIIDRKINEKHVLLVSSGLRYSYMQWGHAAIKKLLLLLALWS